MSPNEFSKICYRPHSRANSLNMKIIATLCFDSLFTTFDSLFQAKSQNLKIVRYFLLIISKLSVPPPNLRRKPKSENIRGISTKYVPSLISGASQNLKMFRYFLVQKLKNLYPLISGASQNLKIIDYIWCLMIFKNISKQRLYICFDSLFGVLDNFSVTCFEKCVLFFKKTMLFMTTTKQDVIELNFEPHGLFCPRF